MGGSPEGRGGLPEGIREAQGFKRVAEAISGSLEGMKGGLIFNR